MSGGKDSDYGVFVSDIARGVTDEMLREEFSKLADVSEAIVVKNKHSGETKGYGFVKFYSLNDCYRAVEWPNPPSFKDGISGKSQMVKITMADTKNTLYIGRIPKDMNEREVKMDLEDISGCTVKSFEFDGPNSSNGFAFFKDHETTIKAIKLIQKSKYSASLTKKSANTAASMSPASYYSDNQSTKVLFARGIKSQDEGDLLHKQLGSTYVDKVVVPLDNQKKVPLGHAFIYCHTIDDAKTLMERNESGLEFQGRSISLAWGLPKQKHRFVDPYAGIYDYSYMLYPEYISQMYAPPPPHYGAGAGGARGGGGRYESGGHSGGGSHHRYSGGSSKHGGHHHPAPHYPYPIVHQPAVKGGYETAYPPPPAFYPPVDRGIRGGRGAPSASYSRYTPY